MSLLALLDPLFYAIRMSETGGFESFQPGEGQAGASEALSEAAKQRFAAAAAQMKQTAKEEKRSRKRDDRVARAIIQFLNDQDHTHLFLLISRLVARDCPSIFILGIVSLIHQSSLETVEEYINEHNVRIDPAIDNSMALTQGGHLPPEINETLIKWITRLQLVMSIDGEKIIRRLLVDAQNIDGSVLQLTTFVLVEFFAKSGRPIVYEQLQPMTLSILQTLIEPHLAHVEKFLLEQEEERKKAEGED